VAESIILNVLGILGLFFTWTFLIYALHRLAHVKNRLNFLYFIHRYHHRVNYFTVAKRKLNWKCFFFYFGSWYETIDVLITMTLPAALLFFIFPPYGIYLLVFHYLYEVFLSESLLDHNPKIKGSVVNFFSWGKYHLSHNKDVRFNYSLIITFWDYVFKTQKIAG
jgi:sterol desaturase/sphingolipid hydroxylase (fatty acid hydroxylase superfamily)